MKRSLSLLFIAFGQLFAGSPASRQQANVLSFPAHMSAAQSAIPHSYNVISYDLYMDWYDVLLKRSSGFAGRMEIAFAPSLTTPLDSIRLDADPTYLTVDSAAANGIPLNTSASDGKLTVFLSTPLSAGQTGKVDIYYHVNDPGVAPNPDSLQRGFYVYYAGTQPNSPPSQTVPHTVAYTMSEPSDARCWMPCYDDPSDKALSRISVRVPTGFVVASNGTQDSTLDNGDGSTTFHWSEGYPISTYLMCATAAKFAVVRESMNLGDRTIPVEYYVYPEDSAAAVQNVNCNIDSVTSMLKFFSSLYGEYPFDKYGMTGIQPFRYGGMEHQTMTTMNRVYQFDRRDVAHELAHQWWGDMVTLGTWKDIWLNESFATYSEAMQLQHLNQGAFENEMLYYASQFFLEDSLQMRYAIYAPPTGYIFGLAEYYKGAWVLHMLRSIVGDSTFFRIFAKYGADYRYGNAVTADFENVVDTVTQTDMSWFFNEWIFGKGYPVYTKSVSQTGDTAFVTIGQIQVDTLIYRMPMEVELYSGGTSATYTVYDSLRSQTFKLYSAVRVDSARLDPNNKILARYPGQTVTRVGTAEQSPSTYSLLQNFPNPFNGSTRVVYNLASPSVVTLELYDVLGRKVETLVHGYQSSGRHEVAINAGQLSSGVYICRLTTPKARMTTKLVLEK